MKKSVPDPPSSAAHDQPLFTVRSDTSNQDALAHLIQLLHGIEATLDEYCCANAGVPGIAMLVNAAHNAQMGRSLAEHVLSHPPG